MEARIVLTFADKVDFAVGSYPQRLVAGDLNGDGKLDLAITMGSVSVLLNTTLPRATTPTFADKTDLATGSGGVPIAIGDLNGDGKLDLVVGNFYSHTISVLINTTSQGAMTPTFADNTDIATESVPISIAIGDLNDDGKPDLVIAENSVNIVSVLLNTTTKEATTPTFTDKTDFNIDSAYSVAIGDLNGDDKPDLAIANIGAGTVSVLFNTTDSNASTPTFTDKASFSVGLNTDCVVIGDLNGDNKPDLAVANSGSNVSVLLNTTTQGATTPAFTDKTDFDSASAPVSVAIGDLNGDGKLDLAVSNFVLNTASVLLNTTMRGATTPAFADSADLATGDGPQSVVIADFNADGRPDLAMANQYSGTVSVLLNDSINTVTSTNTVTLPPTGGNMTALVIDGQLHVRRSQNSPDLIAPVSLDGVGILVFQGSNRDDRLTLDHSLSAFSGSLVFHGGDGSDSFDARAVGIPVLFDGGNGNDSFLGGDGDDSANGGAGNDSLSGGAGNDQLVGGAGNDVLNGGEGNDTLVSEAGNDTLTGDTGDDDMFGGTGNDSLNGGAGNNTLEGEAGNDTLIGSAGDDDMFGGDGSDSLTGGTGNNTLVGEGGSDTLVGGPGKDDMFGGDGNDSLTGGMGNNTLVGEAGNDTLIGGAGDDDMFGGTGNDSLKAGTGNNTLVGEAGNDTLVSATGDDIVFGGDGEDSLNAGAGENTLIGEGGNDTLVAGTGNDVFYGGAGNDSLDGGSGNDTMFGEAGKDTINGGTGDDVIDGGDDNDSLSGSDGNDSLRGGNGNDSLNGGNGNDLLMGSAGDDRLNGMSGDDTLLGESGNDLLNGSAGVDTINPGPDNDHDTVADTTMVIDTSFAFDFDLLLASV